MKKRLAFLLCLVMLFFTLTACGGNKGSEGSNTNDDSGSAASTDVLYHVYHSSPYVTLDPSTEYWFSRMSTKP